jgi:7-keto-8-aminopelargonate synthetase-like enzyme
MPVMQSPPGPETVIDGRRYLYFGGTGYLGLQAHEEVIRAACQALETFGTGSATSRAGFGDTPPVIEVECQAAALFGSEDAFYFPSGYFGPDVLLAALEDSFDAVFLDELSHYCVLEAARVSGQSVFAFLHAQADVLREALKAKLQPGGRPLVVADGVFAALGDISPVPDYVEILADYPGATLVLDDAHALGVLGENGRGTYEHFGLWSEHVNAIPGVSGGRGGLSAPESSKGSPRLLSCATLSKALGGYGGIAPGSRDFVRWLKAASPYYAGTSPPPVPAAAASARGLQIARTQPELRRRLWENVRMVKSGLQAMGLDVDDTPVPIVSMVLGDAANMRRIHRELAERGIFLPYMPEYAGLGPEGAMRLAVFATHTDAMIERLLDDLRRVV